MSGLLRIHDTADHGPLSFDLADLLEIISTEGPSMRWCILYLDEVVWKQDYPLMALEELYAKVDDSPNGLSMSWDELVEISHAIVQTIDGTYIAYREGQVVPEYPGDRFEDLYAASEVVFQAVDSTYWEVYARNDEVLNRYKSAYKAIDVIWHT
jgi:hypothetical protein